MKKLLSIFAAFGLTATGATGVVSCSTSFGRFSKPTLSDKLKKMIIAEIAGKDNDVYGKKTFGDIFNSSETTEKLAVRLVNQIISEYFYGSTQQTWNQWAGGTTTSSSTDNAQVFKSWILQLATDQLYQDYLSSFAQDTYLEYTSIEQNYSLRFDTSQKEGLKWAIPGITYLAENGTPLPPNQLTSYVKPRGNIEKLLYNPQGGIQTLKTELAFTFNRYLFYVEVPKIIDNIIGQAFLNTDMFSNFVDPQGGNKVYVNQVGALMSNMMNWTQYEPSSNNIKSNFLMVWEFKVAAKDQNIAALNTAIRNAQDPNSEAATLNGDNWSPDRMKYFITNTIERSASGDNITDFNKNGGDPIFGIPHFKGFVAYDNQGNILNKFDAGAYATQLKAAKQPGFLKDSTGVYNFADSTNTYDTFAYALPIYVPDLLASLPVTGAASKKYNVASVTFNNNSTINSKQVELKNYNNPGGTAQDLSWTGLGGTLGRSVKYIREGMQATPEPYATFGNTAVGDNKTVAMFTSKGIAQKDVDFTRYNLMQWAQYSFAQGSGIQTLAKDRLYSLAFEYNPKNVYSANLYNDIGKYIEEK